MINTLSICPTCYRKVEATIAFQNDLVILTKICPAHGPFTAIVEKDIQHFSNFYSEGTLGNNNSIIININNSCNMSCPWCYYPIESNNEYKPFSYYDTVLGKYRGYALLMSGGEPTIRPDFFEFTNDGAANGWRMAAITNMLKMSEPEWFEQVLGSPLTAGNMVNFAMSVQHPKNYSKEILTKKIKAIEALETHDKLAMCAMFSIQSLDELDFIREWYNHTKKFYTMLRIRTMFGNWKDKDNKNKLWLSDLHKAFVYKFFDLMPKQSLKIEKSNLYCLYLELADGMQVSLSSSPTVENVDQHQCSRPVYMLAEDQRVHPVPIALIKNEGISRGWINGYKIEENSLCG